MIVMDIEWTPSLLFLDLEIKEIAKNKPQQ